MAPSPIEQILEAIDMLDVDAALRLLTPHARLLSADGRRAEGASGARELVSEFASGLRSTAHRITAQWHVENVWIAEVEASYEFQDWLQLNALPRVFVARMADGAISDLRVYGAHERPLTEHPTGEEGMWIGERWIPPL